MLSHMSTRRKRDASADSRLRREGNSVRRPAANGSTQGSGFERDAEAVLRRLKEALNGMIEGLGTPIRRAVDLERRLGVDGKLAWRIFRFARGKELLAESVKLPPGGSIRRVLAAALDEGTPADAVARARAALDEFESLIGQHAGDRETFNSMISSIDSATHRTQTAAEAVTVRHRRMVFRGMSHLHGVQVGVTVRCRILHPGEAPGTVDSAAIMAKFKWRRLRPGAMMYLSESSVRDDVEGREVTLRPKVEPLDPDADNIAGVGLLPQFCSHPLPRFVDHRLGDGKVIVKLAVEAVGNASSVDSVTALVQRGLPTPLKTPASSCHFTQEMAEPTELGILDVLLPEDYFGRPQVSAATYNHGIEQLVQPAALALTEVVPMPEGVIYLGKGGDALKTPDVPRYEEMVRYACDRLGWDLSKMMVYRCRIRYPVPKWMIKMTFKFPAPPEAR